LAQAIGRVDGEVLMGGRKVSRIDGELQRDLFDSPLTGQAHSERNLLQYPFFDLSKQAARKKISFFSGNVRIDVKAVEGQGIATIYDRDILFYAAGILREKIKEGVIPPPKELVFQAADFYRVAGRSRSNRNYENLESALERLLGTLNKTNLEVGGRGRTGWFTWLAQGTTCVYDIDEKTGERSMKAVRLVLGDWVYDAIVSSPELLSVPDSYFDLKPIFRRLYDIARVNCVNGPWRTTLGQLHYDVGSDGDLPEFKRAVKQAEAAGLPSFEVRITSEFLAPEVEPTNVDGEAQAKPKRGRPSIKNQIVEFLPSKRKLSAKKPTKRIPTETEEPLVLPVAD
jgi:plasmid replication initiation protein